MSASVRASALTVLLLAALAGHASAAVLCARPRPDGRFSTTVRIREACKSGEVQLRPEDVGFCCPSSSTTTTPSTCPVYTTTTVYFPDCAGLPSACSGGGCANDLACVTDPGGGCSCTGAELPCGIHAWMGSCGGACPAGETCSYYTPTDANGCPGYTTCACLPTP